MPKIIGSVKKISTFSSKGGGYDILLEVPHGENDPEVSKLFTSIGQDCEIDLDYSKGQQELFTPDDDEEGEEFDG